MSGRRHGVVHILEHNQDVQRDERMISGRSDEQHSGERGQRDEHPVRSRTPRLEWCQGDSGPHAHRHAEHRQDRADRDQTLLHQVPLVTTYSRPGRGPAGREIDPQDVRLHQDEVKQQHDGQGPPGHRRQTSRHRDAHAPGPSAGQSEHRAHQDQRQEDRRNLHPHARDSRRLDPDLPRPSGDPGRQSGRQDQQAQVRQAHLPASHPLARPLRLDRDRHRFPLHISHANDLRQM